MSDYGASITLIKRDGSPLTEMDKNLVESELNKIKAENELCDSIGEDFLFDMNEIANENTILHIVFSRYWHVGGDEEENFEFAKENDLGEVQKIAEFLRPALNNLFDIKPDFENW